MQREQTAAKIPSALLYLCICFPDKGTVSLVCRVVWAMTQALSIGVTLCFWVNQQMSVWDLMVDAL